MPEVNGIFTIVVQEETVYSDKYEAGEIVKQDPKEGEFRKGDNTVIQVWVSAGEDIGTMIDVTNMTYAAAKVELKSLIEQYDLELVEPTEEEYVYRRRGDGELYHLHGPRCRRTSEKGRHDSLCHQPRARRSSRFPFRSLWASRLMRCWRKSRP